MEDKLKLEIATIVETIFASKKEDEMRQRTEDALRESADTLEAMSTALAAEKAKIVELEEKVEAAEKALADSSEETAKSVASLEAEVKAAADEKETLKVELKEKSDELEAIQKDALTSKRMEELVVAGIAREDKDGQSAKVREMTDEAFASYKEELESIRKTILDELQKKQEAADAAGIAGTEAASADGVVVTPAAKIDPVRSVAAALNMESNPSDDLTAKYADLGIAMAEAMKKDK